MIKDIASLVTPEILLEIQPVCLIPCKEAKNRTGFKSTLVTE